MWNVKKRRKATSGTAASETARRYTLDRREGDRAVLEDDDGRFVTVPLASLPADAAEGDVLMKTEGRFVVDREETARRREASRALRERLQKRD